MKNNKIKSLALKKKTISNVTILSGGRALPTTQQSTVVFTGCVCETRFCDIK